MPIRVAINGFGRIGRTAFKVGFKKPELEIVAINDITDPKTLAHLLQYDSMYGKYEHTVTADDRDIVIGPKKVPTFAEREPAKLPWRNLQVDVVIESTGKFRDPKDAKGHITAGAKRVIISAPSKGEVPAPTYLIGVNADNMGDEAIINNASCTTNCVSPVLAVLEHHFGILKSMMTTVHSYTADQNLQDGPHRDLRRARAAAINIVPTTTGAAESIIAAMPQLVGKFDGLAMRVPTAVGSVCDITALVSKKTAVDEVNAAFEEAVKNPIYHGVLSVTKDPYVSSDVIGATESAIVDLELTQVVDGDLVKVIAWYDNEMGYSHRLIEQVIALGKRLNLV